MADLKTKVVKAKTELERLSRQKGTLHRGDLDTFRRTYFQTGNAPTFLWQVDFAEVFRERGGFDVMIANPPYVRADKGEEHLAMRGDILRSGFYETLWEKWDLYVPFIERAYKMLRPQEVIASKVNEILKALKKGQDVSELENEVDTMVSALYNTEKEQSRAALMAL